jgi:DNA-binding winged helix-turn-helix (wHTH) protein
LTTSASPPVRRRYRFGPFSLSPARRVLERAAVEVPLIPRYFDLLLLLVERRDVAVHRHEIFDAVWSDVVVSDSALTQAIRTVRRALGDDDPREPRFIRTVSRHGYQFVYPDVHEEADGPSATDPPPETKAPPADSGAGLEAALQVLLAPAGEADDDARREAAERLHQGGTEEALARLDRRPGHERARAYLRDARFEVPGAHPVPLVGAPGGLGAFLVLLKLRLRRVLRQVEERWLSAAWGGAAAGFLAGILGGTALVFGPGSHASGSVPVVLALLGMIVAGLGAAGVGAGLAVAEALFRSWRRLPLALFGALGGGFVGAAAHLVGRWTVQGLFGRDLQPVGGGFEGLVVGGAVGLGYALATPRREGGLATPRGGSRLEAAIVTGLFGAAAAAALAGTGSLLGAMSLDFMAHSYPGSQVSIEPLARLIGESVPGPLTRVLIGGSEGFSFGFGLAYGLTHRPSSEATR